MRLKGSGLPVRLVEAFTETLSHLNLSLCPVWLLFLPFHAGLIAPCMWDLRDQAYIPCIDSRILKPLDWQESPSSYILIHLEHKTMWANITHKI